VIKVGVLVSGRGSNLRRLVECDRAGELDGATIAAVVTNRPSCQAAAFARDSGIPLGEFSQRSFPSLGARDRAMADWLGTAGVSLVVNAGYDRILTPAFTSGFETILNVHPSLLPAFGGGMDAVRQALDHGVKVTGCTVHLVEGEVDAGPILLQAAVPVLARDTVETLHERIRREEHRLLPEAVRLLAQGRVRREGRHLRILENAAVP
jgi:phosphoribosylglycinamide formyltransferase-1